MNYKKSQNYQFEFDIKVRDYECDCQGIVNNANYLHYLELTRHEFCLQAGTSFHQMHARGIDPVARKVEIEYLHSLTMGDTMRSCLSMERKGARFLFHQDIFRLPDMLPAARATVTIVCLENGQITRGDILADAFKDYL